MDCTGDAFTLHGEENVVLKGQGVNYIPRKGDERSPHEVLSVLDQTGACSNSQVGGVQMGHSLDEVTIQQPTWPLRIVAK